MPPEPNERNVAPPVLMSQSATFADLGLPDAAGGGLIYIEQSEKTAHCERRGRPYMLAFHQDQQLAVGFKPRCKSWSCPACGPINQALWWFRIHHGISVGQSEGKLPFFITLTSHEKLDAAGSLRVWPQAWANLSARARYAAPGALYAMVAERHQDGRLHWHIVGTWELRERWWKDNARACGLGYMVDLQEISTAAGAAAYISKYLGKSLEGTAWPPGFRRVNVSRNFPKPPPMEREPGWKIIRLKQDKDLLGMSVRLRAAGFFVVLAQHNAAWEWVNGTAP